MASKRTGTLKSGAKIASFDHYYGDYKSLEEAKLALKDVALEGRQFVVKQSDGTVKLYIWQGRGKEPTDISSTTTTETISPTETNAVSGKAVYEAIEEVKITPTSNLFTNPNNP